MSQTIQINNFDDINLRERGELSADVAAGVAALQVANSQNYAANDPVYVGPIGSENGEVVTAQAPSDQTHIPLTAGLKFGHSQFDPIRSLWGTSLRIYTAPDVNGFPPLDSAYTLLTTIPMDTDQAVTYYTDPNGSSALWYRFTYYNSVSGLETNLTDSNPTRGGNLNYYTSPEAVRKEAGFNNNPYITDADITIKILEAQSQIHSALNGMYTTPFQPPIDPMISGITKMLAAGKLLNDEYGPGTGSMSTEGERKINDAVTMLNMIDTRQYILTDVNGTQLISPNSQVSKAFPDATTPQLDVSQGGSHRAFRMGDVGGYYDRKY